ncbi:uncharacterized protein LOC113229922 [Hyposmocoma kahamanoa]|uniref:uncharacterized protein LOC113229922 n=1 Tax=Hyposmocoma kahamanoa TaxID=1477025 RepID=UPI000E6D82D6|nr:uncharacterized protein LOC113229922 [Hyposmocoma kahamanoa]
MKNKADFLFVVILFSIVSVSTGEIDEGRDDIVDINDEPEDEEIDLPTKDDNSNPSCVKMRSNQLHEIRTATYTQFPFMAAVISHQDEYLCSGVVVSKGLILTTSTCANSYRKYVLLNATSDKFDDTTVKLQINRTEMFPCFIGFRSQLDIGLIYTEYYNGTICSNIRISNCTYKTVYDIKGLEAVGYGLNADTGKPKVLQYIGMELKQPVEDLEGLTGYFDCMDTKVPTCFRDTGGPVILDNELVGIVNKGQEECTKQMFSNDTYSKRIADIVPSYTFKAWLEEKIKYHEEVWTNKSLATFSVKPDAISE